MNIIPLVITSLVIFSCRFADTAAPGTLGSSTNDGLHVTKCAKCFYMINDMPLNMSQYLKTPNNDIRCLNWIDNIPVSQYETCSTVMDGEANACMFLNLTITIKNVASAALGQGSQIISQGSSTLNNMSTGNIISKVPGVNTAIPGVNSIPGVNTNTKPKPSSVINTGGISNPFGRKKRQIAGNFPTSILNGGSVGGAVNNVIPTNIIPGIKLPAFTSATNGTYHFKIWYKGCVRLSLLETLTGSHCRLDPDTTDVQLFSQQALLQPLMDVMTTLNSGLAGYSGTQVNVTGLCYIVMKQLAKQLYNTMLHYNFSSSSSSSSPSASSALSFLG